MPTTLFDDALAEAKRILKQSGNTQHVYRVEPKRKVAASFVVVPHGATPPDEARYVHTVPAAGWRPAVPEGGYQAESDYSLRVYDARGNTVCNITK